MAFALAHQAPDTWEYTRGRDLWGKVPPFEYHVPGRTWALRHQALGLALLGAWVVGYGVFWFALAVAVNAIGRPPAFNALVLAVVWLLLVVLVPTIMPSGPRT